MPGKRTQYSTADSRYPPACDPDSGEESGGQEGAGVEGVGRNTEKALRLRPWHGEARSSREWDSQERLGLRRRDSWGMSCQRADGNQANLTLLWGPGILQQAIEISIELAHFLQRPEARLFRHLQQDLGELGQFAQEVLIARGLSVVGVLAVEAWAGQRGIICILGARYIPPATQAGGLRHLNSLPVWWDRSPTCPSSGPLQVGQAFF